MIRFSGKTVKQAVAVMINQAEMLVSSIEDKGVREDGFHVYEIAHWVESDLEDFLRLVVDEVVIFKSGDSYFPEM
jgi:hypothetical protein